VVRIHWRCPRSLLEKLELWIEKRGD